MACDLLRVPGIAAADAVDMLLLRAVGRSGTPRNDVAEACSLTQWPAAAQRQREMSRV